MKGKAYRIYRPGCPHHVYWRGDGGRVIFYSVEDCLCFFTLYSCLARKYGILVRGFCMMPNHIHANEQAPCSQSFISFHGALNSRFTVLYNREHDRSGPLFESPFGFAAKTVGKRVRDNLCYIANNPVVGNLAGDIDSYRWNLLAYNCSDHPFSEKIALSRASRKLRRAVEKVRYFRARNLPLDYVRISQIFGELDSWDRNRLSDYVVAQYNFLDYDAMASFYGKSFRQATLSFRSNSGSEHDIPEDFENYGNYQQMILIARNEGISLSRCNFRKADEQVLARLVYIFQGQGFPERQIERFLHLLE